MSDTEVDRLYSDVREIITMLASQNQPSLVNAANENFRKTLLTAVGSYFEHRMQQILLLFFDEASNGHKMLVEFMENKAVKRQYHTLFAWERRNANDFFGLFGREFLDYMKKEVTQSPQLSDSISDFLELGELRNVLVHGNFHSFPSSKTVDEIYQAFESAQVFLELLPQKFRAFSAVSK